MHSRGGALPISWNVRVSPAVSADAVGATSATVRQPRLRFGFRALAYVDGNCRLVSRKANVYRSFGPLCRDLAKAIHDPVILDGEIVCLDSQGRPQFYDLL